MPIEDEFDWYVAHHEELVDKYDGKVVLVLNHRVISVHDTIAEAYGELLERGLEGVAMIHPVAPGKGNYTFRSGYVRVLEKPEEELPKPEFRQRLPSGEMQIFDWKQMVWLPDQA